MMLLGAFLNQEHADTLVIAERLSLALQAAGTAVWDLDTNSASLGPSTIAAVAFSESSKAMFGFHEAKTGTYETVQGAVHPEDLGRRARSAGARARSGHPEYCIRADER